MDKRIIFLIIIFWLGSAGFFFYRKFYFKPEGISYSIRPRDGMLRTGDSIVFQDQTRGANRWKWDFGDGEFSSEQSGQHLYLIPGKFNVKLTVYGSFGSQRDDKTVVNVLPSSAAVLTASSPSISGPADLTTGQAAKYEANTAAASYEWKVDGDPSMAGHPQKGSAANYTFTKPGVKTIVLTMHNPDNIVRKTVSVMAAAAPAPQPKPVAVAPQRAAPVPHPAKPHPATHQKGNALPDIDNGVEYNKK